MHSIIGALVDNNSNIGTAKLLDLQDVNFIREFDKLAFSIINKIYDKGENVTFDKVCSEAMSKLRTQEDKSNFQRYLLHEIEHKERRSISRAIGQQKFESGYLRVGNIGELLIESSLKKDGSPEEILSSLLLSVSDIMRPKLEGDNGYIDETLDELLDIVDKGVPKGEFIKTGLNVLDDVIGGYKMGELYVVSAGTGQGKSAFMTSLCNNLINNKIPCCLFALEMSKRDVICRMVADRIMINSRALSSGGKSLSEDQKDRARREYIALQEEDIRVFDPENITIEELKGKIVDLAHGDIKVVFIDQLLLISKKEKDKIEKLTSITRELRMLAKRLSICIILAHQPNKQSQKQARESKGAYVPSHLDMRDAPIENDAAVVIIIHRKEFFQGDNVDDCDRGVAQLNVSKNRFGKVGIIRVGFVPEWSKFHNIEG